MDADNNSNDVFVIEDEDSKLSNSSSETRPLMSLFERLISNDTKSNTVLTNAQILSILGKEFDMDIAALHELEIDIYINIVKKFLKDWPQWDAFDRIMTRLKKKEAVTEIKNILEQKYKHLKDYLRKMIEMAVPIANEAVKKIKENNTQTDNETNETVLEIYCTRKMLNKFIFNQPNPTQSNSLFNLMDFEPYKLNPETPTYTFVSMLHWYGVRLSIELPYFQYTRFTAHRLKHVLVNERNGTRVLNKKLDTSLHMKTTKALTNNVQIHTIKLLLYKLVQSYNDKIEYDMIKTIVDIVKTDLLIDSNTIEVPGSYKKHLSKYPYVRRLFENIVTDSPPQNNLFIEETITPIQDFHIGKIINVGTIKYNDINNLQSWLRFECGECKQKFIGPVFLTTLREHFRVYHIDEPDWTCSNCQKSFSMAELTDLGWRHDC